MTLGVPGPELASDYLLELGLLGMGLTTYWDLTKCAIVVSGHRSGLEEY